VSHCDKSDAHVTSTGDTDIEIDIEIDIEKDIDLEKEKTSQTLKTSKDNKDKAKKTKKITKIDDENLKIQYAEFVFLKQEEYEKLTTKYSKGGADRLIEILDNYKGANGKTYKNDYRAILSWVVDRFAQEVKKQNTSTNKNKNTETEYLLNILREEQENDETRNS
jgi:hypothetical protein